MWVAAPPSAHSSASPNKAYVLKNELAALGFKKQAHYENILNHPDKAVVNLLQNIMATVQGTAILYLRSGFCFCPSQMLELCYLVEAC